MLRIFFLFIVFLAVAWSSLPSYDYFPTQNSAYHSALARDYLQDNLAPLLPTSKLQGHFFDQHLTYHLLLAPLVQNAQEPWLILKAVQAIGLALLFLLIFLFISRHQRWYWALVPILFIVSQSHTYYRFYFLRIESLSILLLFTAIISASYLLNRQRYLWWMLIFFVAVLTSWINLVLLALPILKEDENFKTKIKWLAYCCAAFLVTFILKGEGLGGLSYFGGLMNQNFVQDNGISEWAKTTNFWKALLLPTLAFCLSAVIYLRFTKKTFEQTLLLFYFALFFILTAYFKRFETSLFVMTGTCFVYFFGHLPIQREQIKSALGALLVVTFGTSAVTQLVNIQKAPAYATREVTDIRDLHEWAQKNNFSPERMINLRWENWGEMLWYFPQTISEPGLTLSIYNASVPKAMKCIWKLRKSNFNMNGKEFFNCSRILRDSFQTDLLLLPINRQVVQFVEKNPSLVSFVFKGKKTAVLRLNTPSVDITPKFSSQKRPMNFAWIEPRHFLKDNHLQSFRPNGSLIPLDKSTRLRSAYAAWVLCTSGYLEKKDCLAVRDKALEDPMENSVYATYALLGLLNEHLGDKPELTAKLYKKYISDVLPTGQFRGIKYGQGEEIFSPGEVLVFLTTVAKGSEDQNKIKKALEYYSTNYLVMDQQFMIRWLVEATLIYRKKFQDHSFDGVFRVIEKRIDKTWPLVCAPFVGQGQSIFQAGLWLEALARIPDSLLNPDTKLRAFHCNYDSIQILNVGKDKVHFFSGTKGSSVFRIDNHAHAWRGFTDYLSGNWID